MPTSSVFLEKYNQLNSGQKEAVDTIDGPVMVLAGPGTGKTQTLAMRIANILQQTQMDPWNILCLTFTESGVAAMRNRLVSIIGSPAYYVRIHTFHSFCNEVIGEHPELFAKSAHWNKLSDIETVEFFRACIDKLSGTSQLKPFGDPYLYLRDVTDNVKKLKQEDISPKEFQKLLAAIEKFLNATKKDAQIFFSLKAKDRTDAACEDIYDALSKQTQDSALVRMYETYTEHRAVAENARSQGSARTSFKNALKKWYDRMEKQLPKQLDVCRVYGWYQGMLVEKGRYDFEDMIMMVVAAFKTNDALLAEYQEQFQYILVDEYQDTNGAQNEIVQLLGSFDERPNIFVVGDDKQSIYRFQGASLNNMLDFYEQYKVDIRVVSLRENYRSQANVLSAAGSLISHNKEAISKYIPNIESSLIPMKGLPVLQLQLHIVDSEDAERYRVATRVQELIAQGAEPRDIAVLFRYHRDGSELFRMMQRLGIPARLEVGENIFDDICISQMLELLSYLSDMRRDYALANILQFDWLAFPAVDVLKVISYAGRERKRLLAVLESADDLTRAGVQQPEQWTKFVGKIATWKQAMVNTTLQDFLHQLFTESGWLDYVLGDHDKVSCLQKMTRLLQEAKNLNEVSHTISVPEFMHRLGLLQEHGIALVTEPWQSAENAVHLMTAHKAKGLEFEHVIITNFNNKHWGNNVQPAKLHIPHGILKHDYLLVGENNEDERRLFYVAMTRAKQTLMFTRAKHTETGTPTVPSLFLGEIPRELIETHETIEGEEELVTRTVEAVVKKVPKVEADGMKAWLKILLAKHVLSVTHVNNYLECPKKFYIKNVLQVPSVRTPHQALGSAAHKALEVFFAQYEKTTTLPNKQELIEAFDRAIEREVLTKKQQQDAQEVGEAILAEYYDHYKDVFAPSTKREYNFASHGVVIDGIPLTGLIDKIELLDESDKQSNGLWREGARVNVVDYKTGNPERGRKKLKKGGDYYRQLVFYKLLCDESPRFPYTFASAEIDFIQKSDTKGFIKERVEISDADVAELRKEIQDVWQHIQNLDFFEDGAGCNKKDCEYCN